MEINHFKDNFIILIQKKYIQNLLHRDGMKNCALTHTPITQILLTKAFKRYKYEKHLLIAYQSFLNELMHLIVQT